MLMARFELMSNSVNVDRTLANSVNDAAKIQPKSGQNHAGTRKSSSSSGSNKQPARAWVRG